MARVGFGGSSGTSILRRCRNKELVGYLKEDQGSQCGQDSLGQVRLFRGKSQAENGSLGSGVERGRSTPRKVGQQQQRGRRTARPRWISTSDH